MNKNICKRVVSAVSKLKPQYYANSPFSQYVCSNSSRRQVEEVISLNAFHKFMFRPLKRNLTVCQCLKSNDSSAKANKTEKEYIQKALEDEEFQNILKDFARDFGVGSETAEILEDLRKKEHDSEEENEDLCSQNSEDLSSCDTKLNCHHDVGSNEDTPNTEALVLQNYENLQLRYGETAIVQTSPELENCYLQTKRGVTGVFDIEDLIDALRKENLLDIAVISVPKKCHYADFLVLATAKSPRHCEAVVEGILKLYKKKKHLEDPFISAEGKKVANWKAIDMGNIVLHVFLEETRTLYDIEALWLFDSKFDSGGNLKIDPMSDAIEQHMSFFNSMQPECTEVDKEKT